LLGPDIELPLELQNDVLVLTEPLPDRAELTDILAGVYEDAGVEAPDDDYMRPEVEALEGLPAFAAYQASARAMKKDGASLEILRSTKRQMISQTPGLQILEPTERFEHMAGVDNLIEWGRRVIMGPRSPRGYVFIDEIEKAMGGAVGGAQDSSGVAQDFLGQTLTYMDGPDVTGCLLVGVAGTGKSMFAKAMSAEAGVPCITLDLGGMKGSLVGQSEQQYRKALEVIQAVTGGEVMFVATSNNIQALPPELKRRFRAGTFFFDLSTRAELKKAWQYHRGVWLHQDAGEGLPNDTGWTPAEVRNCCEQSYRLGISLEAAAGYIVPVSVSGKAAIAAMRDDADGSYIDAAVAGVYTRGKRADDLARGMRQAMKLA
jgi:hypothetical protein